ncbi:phosphatidic acid phosphatase type 2/haloperoxidase [Cristinia sonorae]|uniref:Phosphatidic acid phosphatase type 2/haloperoxidase n=1 Tax=Cristinia sonorae TaxID=1940300 RepID=A0A8K0XNU8_9AGAR|nr:phosphatidic acid phosphatase type 2/haloperoxidase [Cristinia sonorae]
MDGKITKGLRFILRILYEETNVVVTALTACTILYTRSAAILYFAVGAVVCSRIVKLMKRAFRQPRPINPLPGKQKKDFGMPSTHSAVIAYYATYTMLAAVSLPIHESLPQSQWTRIIPPLVIVPWAASIAISRLWLGHHTVPQVLVGSIHGIVLAPLWLRLWTTYGDEYGGFVERTYMT